MLSLSNVLLNLGRNILCFTTTRFHVTCLCFFFNLMISIPPGVSLLALSSRLSSLLLHPHQLTHHSGTHPSTSLALLSETSLLFIPHLFPPCFYPLPISPSDAPLPDVRRAGLAACWRQPPASWRRGISQMFGRIFIQAS